MFNIFKRKSELEKLQDQYKKLLKESHQLSKVNRTKSDEKIAQANEILMQIDKFHSKS